MYCQVSIAVVPIIGSAIQHQIPAKSRANNSDLQGSYFDMSLSQSARVGLGSVINTDFHYLVSHHCG